MKVRVLRKLQRNTNIKYLASDNCMQHHEVKKKKHEVLLFFSFFHQTHVSLKYSWIYALFYSNKKLSEDFTHQPFLQFRNKLKLQNKSLFIRIALLLGSWGGCDLGTATNTRSKSSPQSVANLPCETASRQVFTEKLLSFQKNRVNLEKSPCIIKCHF